jgi:ATPase subunit of ABC transporter with duplicated ATPase domains
MVLPPSPSELNGYQAPLSHLSFAFLTRTDVVRCAVVISHDRWFLDRIATHILAFEGESKLTFFDGNFSEYEEWHRATLSDAATRPHRITYRKLTR